MFRKLALLAVIQRYNSSQTCDMKSHTSASSFLPFLSINSKYQVENLVLLHEKKTILHDSFPLWTLISAGLHQDMISSQ